MTKMGLTFKKNDDLEKAFERFAILPDDPKVDGKKKPEDEDKKKKDKKD
ncbi:SPJ_0845 family protein [Lactobacillus sp. PV037]